MSACVGFGFQKMCELATEQAVALGRVRGQVRVKFSQVGGLLVVAGDFDDVGVRRSRHHAAGEGEGFGQRQAARQKHNVHFSTRTGGLAGNASALTY